jgi:DNA-binding transcriptional ArsR family regulator
MDSRKLAGLASEQGRNARRIRTIDKQLKLLAEKLRGLNIDRERLYARNGAIDEVLLEGAPATPERKPRELVRRDGSMLDQITAAIGRKGLNEFGAGELTLELGLPSRDVSTALSRLNGLGKLHRVDRGRYRVQRGVLAS